MTDQVAYLSPQWLIEADQAVASLAPLEAGLVVAITVTGGPQGQYVYTLTLGPARVGFQHLDSAASSSTASSQADVSMTMGFDVAAGVAQGQIGAQRAFLDGDIKLDGDITRLLGHQEALAAVDDQLAALRARTDFSHR